MTTLFINSYGAKIVLDTEAGGEDGTTVFAHIETVEGEAQESKPLIQLLSGYWEKVAEITSTNWGTMPEPEVIEATEEVEVVEEAAE